MVKSHCSRFNQKGLSYLEVIISTVLISIALVPVLDAFYIGGLSSSAYLQKINHQKRLINKLEQVLITPIGELIDLTNEVESIDVIVPAPLSDTEDQESRVLVFLSHYDGDNADNDNNVFTGTDVGLLWIKVAIEGTELAIETLKYE